MTLAEFRATLDERTLGQQLYECAADLYPICRSITGEGVRETLRRLQQRVALTIHEVPSGTQVLDWTVPPEWNIQDGYVKNARGERVVDFQRSNLHVVNYSVPVHARMSLAELRPHLFTLPERPEWIPYRTSYYTESWGFCLSQRQLDALTEDEYEVCIDSSLRPGSLSYGECYLAGGSADEILISCHVCHPSLANDNLSGIAIAAFLGRHLAELSHRYSYRVLFVPGTIGAIAWLARNEVAVERITHGLVLTCLGDAGRLTYKKSRRGDAAVDRAAMHVLRQFGDHEVLEFSPYGYDERQFCSPGFNLPVGRLSRTPHDRFPEYHTSGDDLNLIQASPLAASFAACLAILDVLESDRTYVNQNPKGEPQLGRRGLYHPIGGLSSLPANEMAMLWALNLSDGRHSLLDIANRSGCAFDSVRRPSVPAPTESILRPCHVSGRRVLVTGASGFIGSHLCRRLLGEGAEIHAVSRKVHPGIERTVRWWEGDLADMATVRGIFRGAKPEFVFHLASHVTGAQTVEHVLPTFHNNLQTTVNLLTAVAERRCRRIVLAGSLVEPPPGEAEAAPCSPYAAAKCASSAYARMFHVLYGVPTVVARVFMVYGPGQRDSTKLIPSVILALLRGRRPRIGSGDRLVDWIYVDDVVDGLLAAAQGPVGAGSTIDLGSGQLVSIRDIVRRLTTLVDARIRPAFGVVPDRPLEPIRRADTSSTYAAIGWKPSTALETGLPLTVKWYAGELDRFPATRRAARGRR